MEPLKPLYEVTAADGRWEILGLGLSDIHARVAAMSLDEQVPERVCVQFQQAQHLLVYSYYQFSFLSVATMQAYVALEAALEERFWIEKGGPLDGTEPHLGLRKLLKHARSRGWLPELPDQFPDLVAKMRNYQAHGAYMLDPWHTMHFVGTTAEIIRTLFLAKTDEVKSASVSRAS
jgi:hypothetical protein